MLMGDPETTELAPTTGSYEAAYQHIWWPGRAAEYPVPYSLESKLLDIRSKLVQGALIRRMGLAVANCGPMIATPEFVAKRIVWLYPDADDAHGSGTVDERGKTRPARMTSAPAVTVEEPWHWRQMAPYPQIDGADNMAVTSVSFALGFTQLLGIFGGGSGDEIDSYRADKFTTSGRATVLFEDEGLWEQFLRGRAFRLDLALIGETIQGAYANRLSATVYACVVDDTRFVNRVGDLTYDFGWTAQHSPSVGRECQWTLINTTSSYL